MRRQQPRARKLCLVGDFYFRPLRARVRWVDYILPAKVLCAAAVCGQPQATDSSQLSTGAVLSQS